MGDEVAPRRSRALQALAAVTAGLWAGVLLGIALVAAPAAFATLAPADAGRFVGRVFAQEADGSLVIALLLIAVERWRARRARRAQLTETGPSVFSAEVLLLLGCVFCTVAGYFAVVPMMAAARIGQGALSFGALHAISGGFFALKGLLVLALAWRLVRTAGTTS